MPGIFTHPNRRIMLLGTAGLALSACGNRANGGPASQRLSAPVETGEWRANTAPNLPFAVQEIYPGLHAGRIHLAGGFLDFASPDAGPTDRHISWAPGDASWQSETPLPERRHHPQLVSFKGALLAIGGFTATAESAGWIMQSTGWQLQGDTWTDAPALPQPNGESVTAVLSDQLHICGGRVPSGQINRTWNNHTDTGHHFTLDNLTGHWQTAAPLPTARNSAAAAVIGSKWHVVGGRTVSGGNNSEHDIYDPVEDRWRSGAPMPRAQGGLAAASVGNRLFAFGGEYFNRGGGVYPEAWAYDSDKDEWSHIPDMPHPRHGLGAVALDGRIYVIGGALRVGGNQTSDLVEVFAP